MATRTHALYRLLERPAEDAAQGGCYLTGGQGPCIDTGVIVDFEGTLTLSLNALVEMCEVAGFSFNVEARRLEEDLANSERLIAGLNNENADLRLQLDAVALAVASAMAPAPRKPKAKAKPLPAKVTK